MNKKEAIQVLQTALTAPFVYGAYAEALNMAIESLSTDRPTKCIAQINIDADEVVKRIKDEYEIAALEKESEDNQNDRYEK